MANFCLSRGRPHQLQQQHHDHSQQQSNQPGQQDQTQHRWVGRRTGEEGRFHHLQRAHLTALALLETSFDRLGAQELLVALGACHCVHQPVVLAAQANQPGQVGAALADDSLVALVGWQVFFYKHIAGLPPTDVFWRATIVSYTETVITVDAMPDGFSSTGFTLYIMPPGWGSIASDAPTAAEIRAEMDSNSTQLAAIVEDTGTTLPASISALSTLISAELSNTSDSTASGAISRTRGNTWSISTTIGAITGYTSLWFTVKHSKDDADSEAILQIKKNASETGDGLIYKNGSSDVTAGNGSITVSDASTGAIVIALDEADTDDMPVGAFYYDIQALISDTITTPDSGTFTVTADVTRSIA